MGTRADFYLGRDPATMKYLGSLGWDGYPRGIMRNPGRPDGDRVLLATNADEYEAAVGMMITSCSDGSLPERDGWPWPWDDSGTTDYTYAFDDGVVYASIFGREWFVPVENGMPREPVDGYSDLDSTVVFPNMVAIKKATLGPRSGLIVIRS